MSNSPTPAAPAAVPAVKELDEQKFETDVLKSALPTALHFYAPESAPSKELEPRFGAVAEKFAAKVQFMRIAKDKGAAIAGKLGVTEVPTLLFFKGGKELGDRLSGDVKRTDIKARVEALLK